MSEVYTVVLNTKNTNNCTILNSTALCQFYVNWKAILPHNYKKYEVKFSLKTQVSQLSQTGSSRMDITLGSNNTFGQNNNMSSNTMLVIPKSYQGSVVNYYFETNKLDQESMTVNYNSLNDYINVTMFAFNGTLNGPPFLDYILFMYFRPIKE